MDGKAARETMMRYQDSFKEPPPAVNVINIGGAIGSCAADSKSAAINSHSGMKGAGIIERESSTHPHRLFNLDLNQFIFQR